MTTNQRADDPMRDPEGRLESAFIDEFLRTKGFDPAAVRALPDDQAKHLLTEASVYAASKLAEVGARAHYVHDIHRHE